VHDRIGIGIRIKRRIEGEMSGGTSGEIGGCSAGGVVKTGEETTLDKKVGSPLIFPEGLIVI